MRSLLGIWILILSLPAVADESVSAKIVSIYRPLEMESRRVRVERKVFIQSESELDFPDKLVGQTLTVFRLRKVPAQVNMKPSTSIVEIPEPPMTGSTLRTDNNKKGKRLAPLEGGRPAGFAAPSERSLTKVPVHLGAESTNHDLVRRVSAPPIEASTVKSKVGQIKVLSVEGNVAIAVVVQDGIREVTKGRPSVKKVEGSTVSAGDFAEGIIKKIVPKKKAKPLSASEKKALRSERDRIRRMNKPKKKRSKYRRKSMQWDL